MSEKVAWMDQQTKKWLQWSWAWNQINPLSLYGNEVKRDMVPYLKGQEEKWMEEMKQTRKLEALGKTGMVGKSGKISNLDKAELEDALSSLNDPRPFLHLLKKGETGVEADWFHLKQFLWNIRIIFKRLSTFDPFVEEALQLVRKLLNTLQEDQLSFSLEEGTQRLGLLSRQKAKITQELIQVREHQRQRIEDKLQTSIKGKEQLFISTKDKALISKCLVNEELEKVRETPFEIIFTMNKTLDEMVLLQQLELVEKEVDQEEKRRLGELGAYFVPYLTNIEKWTKWVGLWDWRWAKVKWLQDEERCWPIHNNEKVHVNEGRYLPLSQSLTAKGKSYTPLSITCGPGLTTLVGSNMGGKSIAIKTMGLLVALAHYGLPVPARSLRTPLFLTLVAVSGDQQSFEEGVSTFGAEMLRLSRYIEENDQLLFIDELARGTNPKEGEALALAIGKTLAEKKEQTAVMITHFSILSSIKKARHYRVIGLEVEGSMNYQLVENNQHDVPHHALMIAKRLGLPISIIEEAERQIREGEKHGEATFRSRED